jgi:uncharacterized protein
MTVLASARAVPATSPRRRLWPTAAVAGGVAIAWLVGADGTVGWRALRVLVVAALTGWFVVVGNRMSDRGRGRLGVVVGVGWIVVAAGFAPHLVRTGATGVRAATAILAVVGLGLTIGGTVLATRGRGRLRRLGSSMAVLAAMSLVAFVVSPPVAATNVPRPPIGATPASVGLAYADVSLRTVDHVTLAGWYVPSTNGAALVLLHGAGSTRSDVVAHAAVLARHGFGVLMVDARGHGDSGGRAMDFGWQGDADIAAAIDFLTDRSDVSSDRIGVVGLSMGGEEAIGASGSNQLIRAVVAEGATARRASDKAWLTDRYGFRGFVQVQLEHVQDWVTDVLTRAPPPTPLRAAVERSAARYLLVTAGNVGDEGHAAAHLRAAAPDRVEVWTVPHADHTGGLGTAPEAWEARVSTFLTDALASRQPG